LSKLMLFVPPAVIFARSLFYTIYPGFVAMTMALLGASLFVTAKEKAEKSSGAKVVQAMGAFITSVGIMTDKHIEISPGSPDAALLESGNYLHHTLPLRNPHTAGEGFNEAALVYYRSMIFSRPKNLS